MILSFCEMFFWLQIKERFSVLQVINQSNNSSVDCEQTTAITLMKTKKKKCLVNKVRRSMGSKRFKRKKILTVKSFTQTFWVSTEETGHESLGRQWCKIRRKLPAAPKTVIQKAYPGCADDANEVWWDFTPWKHHRMWWLHVIMLTKPILNITPITFYHSQFERCATEQVPHRSLYSSSAFHQRC